MNADDLRATQAPLKARYKDDPATARATLRVVGRIDPASQTCTIESGHGPVVVAGLHPAAGGDGTAACSAEILLQSLAACAGVTLGTVATAMGVPVRGGTVTAEGDLDWRGTLGVSKEAPVGFRDVRLRFDLDTAADDTQLATLLKLTERYCVIFQTLKNSPGLTSSCERAPVDRA
jgi:uncharacterized OsmC-like protein